MLTTSNSFIISGSALQEFVMPSIGLLARKMGRGAIPEKFYGINHEFLVYFVGYLSSFVSKRHGSAVLLRKMCSNISCILINVISYLTPFFQK